VNRGSEAVGMAETEHWLAPPVKANLGEIVVGTLGPTGTSSEVAARIVCDKIGQSADPAGRIKLYGTYEEAAESLRQRQVSHIVVANAYSAINEFYMDTRISLAAAFVMDTPKYGVVRRRGQEVSRRPKIATHPAPRPLLSQLLPRYLTDSEVLHVSSTSAAAKAVYEETVDLALTTATAAETYGLEFISPTRTIRMLWSVFVRS
jgi:prephenate dehydratase